MVAPTPVPSTWKGLNRAFDSAHEDVQAFFHEYPKLLPQFSWDTCMGYLFTRIERGHRRALYGGVVKRHLVDPDLAWRAVQRWEMRRAEFRSRFSEVFEAPFPKELGNILEEAEDVRDRVIHGGHVSDADHRRGAVRALDYANGFQSLVVGTAGFSPFGDMRGFTGRVQKLQKATSRLVLKGLGFPIQ